MSHEKDSFKLKITMMMMIMMEESIFCIHSRLFKKEIDNYKQCVFYVILKEN